MTNSTLTWKLVDDIASDLGVKPATRIKWRQRKTQVPHKWRIDIAQELMERGLPVSLADFERLPHQPGRIG